MHETIWNTLSYSRICRIFSSAVLQLSASVSIAEKLREGTLKDDEALAEKVKNAYGEHMYKRIISVAKKLLKYPDITRAAYGPVYKETIDK